MVTGATIGDLVVILNDARKDVLAQTRRHAYLARLVGIRQIVLAVNKMNLVGHDQATFDAIIDEFHRFGTTIAIDRFATIHPSGLTSANVADPAPRVLWFTG